MLTKMNHSQTIRVKRDKEIIATVIGTWYRGRGWYYIRKHPGSRYTKELVSQLEKANCSQGEINSIIF